MPTLCEIIDVLQEVIHLVEKVDPNSPLLEKLKKLLAILKHGLPHIK
jgi:hypothetical protein